MTRIFINLLPESSANRYVYNAGDLEVVVSLDRSLKVGDPYSFFLYNTQLMLMGTATTDDGSAQRGAGRSLKMTFATPAVWIPGDYFLLMRSGADVIIRFDLRLAPDGTLHTAEGRPCADLSDEDMLSGRLANHLSMWQRLSRRPGMRQVKAWALRRAQENELVLRRSQLGGGTLELNCNLLLAGRSGRFLPLAVHLLKMVAAIPGTLKSTDCSQLFDSTSNDPYERLRSTYSDEVSTDNLLGLPLPKSDNIIYSYHSIGALADSGGKTIMKTILGHWPGQGKSAIFIGTQQEIDAILEQYPSMQEHFPATNRLCEETFTREELIWLFFSEADIAKLLLSPGAKDKMCRLLSEAHSQGITANWTFGDVRRYVNDTLLPQYMSGTLDRMRQGRQLFNIHLLQPDDIDSDSLTGHSSGCDEALSELDSMVGLDGIKKNIATLTNRMRIMAGRRSMGLPATNSATHHALFLGNPGTGKTTVARLLGKVYHSLGLLSKGDVVCVDRQRIIGRYIGETEENMKQILHEAQGNVLFVDEAYTLYAKDDSKDFGRHAVEALLDALSRDNPDMVVVFAGYEREMNQLLSLNPGLDGRFPYKFHFADYNAEQLMQIALAVLKGEEYELTAEARDALLHCIREALQTRSEGFANARWVRQLVQGGILPAMADRLAALSRPLSRTDYQRIEATDIHAAYERFNPRTVALHPRRAVGFCA